MKYLVILFFTLMATTSSTVLIDFSDQNLMGRWYVVDDVVMGGRSNGNLTLTEDGYGRFAGTVSLENNGGFSSIRSRFPSQKVSSNGKLKIRLKGDGNRFQFRVKSSADDYYSYISYFETSGEWETIEIRLDSMYPSFRGRKLNRPNFQANQIEEIAILIANKKPQHFELLLDKIELSL